MANLKVAKPTRQDFDICHHMNKHSLLLDMARKAFKYYIARNRHSDISDIRQRELWIMLEKTVKPKTKKQMEQQFEEAMKMVQENNLADLILLTTALQNSEFSGCSKENSELLQKAINGDKEAISELEYLINNKK